MHLHVNLNLVKKYYDRENASLCSYYLCKQKSHENILGIAVQMHEWYKLEHFLFKVCSGLSERKRLH